MPSTCNSLYVVQQYWQEWMDAAVLACRLWRDRPRAWWWQYLTPTCGSGKWTDDLDSSAGRAVQDALGPGKNDVNARTPPYIMPNSESQPAWPMGLCKPVSNFTWCAIMLAIQQLRDQQAVYSSLRGLRRIFIVNKANIYITSLCKASFDTA